MRRRFLACAGLGLGLVCVVAKASAAVEYPNVSTETHVEMQNDVVQLPGGKTGQNLSFTAEHQTLFELDEHWSVINLLSWEQINAPPPGTRTVFENQGLYVNKLYVQWRDARATVKAGLFTENFGRAWWMVRGLYVTSFVDDYKMIDQWGAQASWALVQGDHGQQQISLSDSMADRTIFYQTMFYDSGKLTYQVGGPTNTRTPNSYVATYDGSDVPVGVGKIGYHLSYAALGHGLGDTGTEHRLALSGNLAVPIFGGEDASGLRLFGEAVRRWDAQGVAGKTMEYFTGAVEMGRGKWVVDLSGTERQIRAVAQRGHDHLSQLSVGYNLTDHTTIAAAMAEQRVRGVQSQYVGLLLAYSFNSCTHCRIGWWQD